MKRIAVSILVLVTAFMSSIVLAGEVELTSPEEVGFSSERFTRIDEYVERHLEANHFAGAVTLVARRGHVVHFKAYGMQDIEADVPMSTNSIFRFYSMTKPITSVAVMMLWEEGHFLLNDPVSKYLPEFKDMGVGVEKTDKKTAKKLLVTVPSDREVTIRDLLRHTSGLTYGFWGQSLVDQQYLEKGILTKDKTIEELVAKLGTIPLKHQPGTVWEYSVSTDVLGRFVEVVSGQPFDEFLRDRIFGPLGMKDTGFYVPIEDAHRLATAYRPNDDNTAVSRLEPKKADDTSKDTTYRIADFTEEPTFLSGGGGLVSTASDYLRFAQMLLNRGGLDGVRVLGPETIELMTRNHMEDIPLWKGFGNYGFGLGFAVSPDRGDSGSILSEGSYWWGGMAHTTFWVDPAEELIGIFLVQILPTSPIPYRDLFKPVVYQAIVD